MVGGLLADRLGVIRATATSLAVLSAVLVLVALDDFAPGLYASPVPLFALVYWGIGALTASSYALFMTLSRGEFAATRFSVFMAMTNACEAWAGFVGGRFAVHGYGLTLLSLTAVSCMAALPLAMVSKSFYRRELNETGRRTA
jgi:hypothetical protein